MKAFDCCSVRFHLHFHDNAIMLCPSHRWRYSSTNFQNMCSDWCAFRHLVSRQWSHMFWNSHFIEGMYSMTFNLYFNSDSLEMLPIPPHFFTSIFYTPLVLDPHALLWHVFFPFIRILGWCVSLQLEKYLF